MTDKPYDFEQRSRQFARKVKFFTEKIPYSISNTEYTKQLIRSSGSIGANFIEADEALGKKDRVMHMRISRKEAKESIHWLDLIDAGNNTELQKEQTYLKDEANQLLRILSSIILKLTQ
ncbi:MAG: four helix bundle protein [Patescibacteria group bacterium]